MDFWIELWSFVCSHPPVFPKKLVGDIYAIGWKMQRDGTDYHSSLCWCAKDLAKYSKKRLPDNLHNRMVLGPQNKHTVEYVKKWGV